MNDVQELKRYVGSHAQGQRIKGYRELLDRIEADEGGGPGSWVGEWVRAGEALERRGRHLDAARHYTMARFPFVDGPDRQDALERGVRSIDRWAAEREGVELLTIEADGGTVRCWASGLSAADPKPLLVIMGGIVTVKEQWAPLLAGMRRLGVAGIVTEMPGTGENGLRYGPDSWRMLPAILDAVAGRADVADTYAIALSFSGHMALRCATEDPRLRGVITVGAPIGEFFTDTGWQRRLPRITVDALAHMIGVPSGEVAGGLGEWALSAARLAKLDVPVCYTASLRDEIIPPADVRLLRDNVRRLELVEHDDVHGCPAHQRETQLWTVASLFRCRNVRSPAGGLIGLLLKAERARGRLSRNRA
ncbi:alpha/beta hydrolase [Actinomadura syzygii]|uniref:Alpha/beta hydrolase n=1 Tax=Actinomadura syzygii TaxID=1427538 RepID=A0A5D0UG72_9ACTN|nr:alpha/beta hydrolase [Actinomadura syzygii]TYC17501.1 alpha/beta hydrolase [Actinomadura syzygii]